MHFPAAPSINELMGLTLIDAAPEVDVSSFFDLSFVFQVPGSLDPRGLTKAHALGVTSLLRTVLLL
jgi:hypothetical protein